jgi:hypothetical protein
VRLAGAPKFAVVLALRSLRLHGLPVPHLPSDLEGANKASSQQLLSASVPSWTQWHERVRMAVKNTEIIDAACVVTRALSVCPAALHA